MRFDLLQRFLAQPSAPFREAHVAQTLCEHFERERIPHFVDPIGNIVVGVATQKEYLQRIRRVSREPLRVFISHMDHPGFHGERWLAPKRLRIQWHGGSPIKKLDGARVWIADASGWRGSGILKKVKMRPSGRAIESAEVAVTDATLSQEPAKAFFGGFQFRAPVWRQGKLVYTKAADDLVGAFATASLAMKLYRSRRAGHENFIGLLTRAEEVGFIGAIGHFELGWLQKAKRKVLCVSLETSRTLPGADIGKGPVVRLGDRATVFDASALRVFRAIAQKTLPGKHQMRVMDGGTCEGTAATAYGFASIGISIPLGNYHNQSFQGGPDSRGPDGPAPEFVHLDDIEGLLKLCEGLMQNSLPWSRPWDEMTRGFRKELARYRRLLRY